MMPTPWKCSAWSPGDYIVTERDTGRRIGVVQRLPDARQPWRICDGPGQGRHFWRRKDAAHFIWINSGGDDA